MDRSDGGGTRLTLPTEGNTEANMVGPWFGFEGSAAHQVGVELGIVQSIFGENRHPAVDVHIQATAGKYLPL